ncbi:peptidyl-prolyl cis-trans isomerase [Myxococcota bacterium]|nr:peptidyl-prolyl cis-trans isomerase [Myxococcota bacterium]
MTSLHRRRSTWRSALAFVALTVAGCTKTEEKKAPPYPVPEVTREGKTLAKVGPVALTTAELERRIAQQSPFVKAQLKDPEQKKKFVENEIKMELLAQEGWRLGMYEDPKILAELRRAIVSKMMRDKLAELAGNVDATESELIEAYKKKEADFVKPEKIRVSMLLLAAATPDAKKQAAKKLEALKVKLDAELKKGNEPALAQAIREQSQDQATRLNGGDLNFLSREELTERLGQPAADRLFDKTEVGELVLEETKDGVALLRKTGKRRAVERTLEMVKPQIRSNVLAEKRAAVFDKYVEELKKAHGVELDAELIEGLSVEIPPSGAVQQGGGIPVQLQPGTAQPGAAQPEGQPHAEGH